MTDTTTPSMSSLDDWYRYVDNVSRPVRQPGDTQTEGEGWRPWHGRSPAGAEDPGPPPVRMPSLAQLLDLPEDLAHLSPATREFEDPTIYDELPPLTEYHSPSLSAPSFELGVPPQARSALLFPGSAGETGETVEDVETSTEDELSPLDEQQLTEMVREIRSEQSEPSAERPAARRELLNRAMNQVLTLEETARILDVCPTTVRRYTNRGSLKHFRTPGNQRRFRLADVLEFIETRPDAADAAG